MVLRQLVWHSGDKGFGAEYPRCEGAFDQQLRGPWMLLETVLRIGTNDGITRLRGVKTSSFPFQPKQEAINNIPPPGTLLWDCKRTR